MSNMKALEGQWYSDRSTRDVFCVIGIDESEGLIDIRDGYGDIDEFDFDEWESMDLVLCGAPEDWSAVEEMSEELDGEEAGAQISSSLYDAMQEAAAQRPVSVERR
jgi:hypothetical protein